MPRQRSTGERYVMWIESYCVRPVAGPERGQRVKLTDAQKETVRRIYDQGDNLEVIGPLAAYLALLHVCGPEAVRPMTQPGRFTTDVFTAWAATGPRLKEVLRREGERIVCPQLGTRYPTAA
jgi:hypothetical protein